MAVQRNHSIQVGDIFETDGASLFDECGSTTTFYQVTALRGKTLVVLSQLKARHFADGEKDRALGCGGPNCYCEPLPGQFRERTPGEDDEDQSRTINVLARAYKSEDGGDRLHKVIKKSGEWSSGWGSRELYTPYRPGHMYYSSGYYAGYDLADLKKGVTEW